MDGRRKWLVDSGESGLSYVARGGPCQVAAVGSMVNNGRWKVVGSGLSIDDEW